MPVQKLESGSILTLAEGEYWDALQPGLVLRVSPNGVRSWSVRYRINGKRRRLALGRFDAVGLASARKRARSVLAQADDGGDPASKVAEKKTAGTFRELAELFLEHHSRRNKRPSSYREDQRILRSRDLDALHDRPAREIRREDVDAVLARIAGRGAPVMANRTLAAISATFNFAIELGRTSANPCARAFRGRGKRLPGGREQPRTRVLSEDEITTLLRYLDTGERLPQEAALYRLMLWTAARPGEVRKMRWDCVEADLWCVPAADAKNGREHVVPLPRQAVILLDKLRALTGDSAWVLESWRNPGHPTAKTHRGHAAIVTASGMEPWRAHDLRRTTATHLARRGVDPLLVERILNHALPGDQLRGTYQRYAFVDEMRVALQGWADRLGALLAS